MDTPNNNAMFKWRKPFIVGQDFLQLIRESDNQVQGWIDESGLPQGSLAPPPPPPPLSMSFFTNNSPGASVGNGVKIAGTGGFTGSGPGGGIGGFTFFLPAQIETSGIIVYVLTPDSTNEYDIGIYGPLTESVPFTYPSPTFVSTTLPLICSTGPTMYATGSEPVGTPWITPVTIPAGLYVVLFTTAGSSGLDLVLSGFTAAGSGDVNPFILPGISTSSAGSTLPASVSGLVWSVAIAQSQPLSINFGLY